MNVYKIIPKSDKSRFFAFKSDFASTISTDQKVKITKLNYIP